jgi:hypothetical protein
MLVKLSASRVSWYRSTNEAHDQIRKSEILICKSEININFVEFEFLTESVMKSSIFWDIAPYNSLKDNRRFEGTCLLQVQNLQILNVWQ